jgi:hypothetical protein
MPPVDWLSDSLASTDPASRAPDAAVQISQTRATLLVGARARAEPVSCGAPPALGWSLPLVENTLVLRLGCGDLFEIVLIQAKGGTSRLPTVSDIARLHAVADHHRASAVVLATWRRGKELRLAKLKNGDWADAEPQDIFG